MSRLDLICQELSAVSFAVGLPFLFFPFSRTGGIALDLFLNRRPKATPERHLRGHEVRPPADRERGKTAGGESGP